MFEKVGFRQPRLSPSQLKRSHGMEIEQAGDLFDIRVMTPEDGKGRRRVVKPMRAVKADDADRIARRLAQQFDVPAVNVSIELEAEHSK